MAIRGVLFDSGLHGFFDVFVISAVLGYRKPDPRMYRAGSDALGLAPGECLFVDDDPVLVDAAIRLGYHGLAVARDTSPPVSVPAVTSLNELVPILCRE